jgi:3-phenylpropionate/cinnamic acid dioxygenase small subunit
MTAAQQTDLESMLLNFAVQQFYADEATLLDERRLQEWLGLLHPEVYYWAPTRRTREDGADTAVPGELGLFEDNVMTLSLRVASMLAPSAWAEQPPSRTRRLITNVQARRESDGSVAATSNFLVYRSRLNDIEHLFVGRRTDVLVAADEAPAFRIRQRTVLLDHQAFRTDNISVLF